MSSHLEFEDELEISQPGLEAQFEDREIIGTDDRVRVTNTLLFPFRFICNLEYRGEPICSGTLIGPRTVLTAGHCLHGMEPKLLRVIPGRNGFAEPLGASVASAFHIPSGWAPATKTDYGIINLKDPIGTRVGFWSRTYRRLRGDGSGTSISASPLPLAAGTLKVNVSGYPSDKCIRRSAASKQLCGALQLRAYDKTVRLADGLLTYLDDTFPGHSGSPVWVRRHPTMGGRVLVAIHIAGMGGKNGGVRINDTVLRFIAAHTI
jgi:glutamyl endopeptidase